MYELKRFSLFAILSLAGILLAHGGLDAGVIQGRFYETDGITQITGETITVKVVDSAGNTTSYGGNYAGGTYSINIGSLVPVDKSISIIIIRAGVTKATLTDMNGNPQRPQTIDILIPK